MFPLHWSTLWFGFVVMHPWFVPSNNPVKYLSPLSAYHKRCCKDRPIQLLLSQSFSSLSTHHAHTFWNFTWSCIMLYAKPREHPSTVATLSLYLLSARIISSTCCTVLSVAISTGRSDQASSATFKYPWVNFSTQLWTVLCDEHFPPQIENISLWISFARSTFSQKKMHNWTLLFSNTLLKHSHHFDYCNQPLNMGICIFYLDCYEAGLCCYLVIHIENLLHPL
jgi:hypothetical protein